MRKIFVTRKSRRIFWLITLILYCSLLEAQLQLQKVEIIANRNNTPYWTNSSIIADAGDNLRLSFILTVRPGNLYSSLYVSPMKNIILDGDTLDGKTLVVPKDIMTESTIIKWYRVAPEKLDTVYTNQLGFVTPYVTVCYRELPLQEWQNSPEINLNATAIYRDLFPGSVWLKVEICHGRDFISSAGADQRCQTDRGYDFGGLGEAIFRISCRGRTGSKLLDNVLLYRNVPLIANPVSYDQFWHNHQTIKWIGGNLSSFIVAAAMQLDVSLLDYVDKLPLPEYNYFEITEYYRKELVLQSDFYIGCDNGKKVLLNEHLFHQGDIIISRDRVALFYRDQSTPDSDKMGDANALLDRRDLVLECNESSLRIGTLQEVLGDTVSLVRWKRRWSSY